MSIRSTGFSLVETMVALGVVSVVGLGMYSGFQQLNDAVNKNEALSQAALSQGLLLPLLESDLATHGLGVENPAPPCLIEFDYTTQTWLSSCDGDLITSPAPGSVTCRSNPNGPGVQLTANYLVTAETLALTSPSSSQEIARAYAATSDPLNWAVRHTWTQTSCSEFDQGSLSAWLDSNQDLSSAAFAATLPSQLIDTNVAELSFSDGAGAGVFEVNFSPNIKRVQQTVGSTTSLASPTAVQSPSIEAVPVIDTNRPSQSVGFLFDEYLLRPAGASAPAHIPTSMQVPLARSPAPDQPLNVAYTLERKQNDGTWSSIGSGTYQFAAGRPISQNVITLSANNRIRLNSGSAYSLGAIPVTLGLSTETHDSAGDKPSVRLLAAQDKIQRAPGSKAFFAVLLDRPIPDDPQTPQLTVAYSGDVCAPLNHASASFFVSAKTVTDTVLDTCNAPEITQGSLEFSLGAASGPRNMIELAVEIAETGDPASIQLELQPDPDGKFQMTGSPSVTLDIVTQGLLPEVNFVSTRATAIEPVVGEQRTAELQVSFDPPPTEEIPLVVVDTTSQLACGTQSNYVILDSDNSPFLVNSGETDITIGEQTLSVWPSATPGSCMNITETTGESLFPVTIPAGTTIASIPIQLYPSDAIEDGFELNFELAPNPAYTIGDTDAATVELKEYGRVAFTAASVAIDEDTPSSLGWQNKNLTMSVTPAPERPLTAYVSITPGDPNDPTVLNADIPNDVQILSNPLVINIPIGASSATVDFQLENDSDYDRGKSFLATIDRVVGGALPGPTPGLASPLHSTVATIIDQDRCAIGAGLTGGQSPTDHFNSRGTTVLGAATILGATVRVNDGSSAALDAFDSVNDRLVLADVPDDQINENDNTITYSNVEYTTASNNQWTFNAQYFVEQGVMEIAAADPGGVPSLDVIAFIRDRVNYQNGGMAAGDRSVTFSLGLGIQGFEHPDGTTHYYRYVPMNDNFRDWSEARDEASSVDWEFFGQTGYLATITSRAENNFLARRFNLNGGAASGWLAGSDADNEGEWYWVSGPEAGQQFWQGERTDGRAIDLTGDDVATAKSCVDQTMERNFSDHQDGDLYYLQYDAGNTALRFANWSCYNTTNGMEPNNSGGSEDYLQITGSSVGGGMWNDLPVDLDLDDTESAYAVNGFYIEYGGPEKSPFGIRNLKLSQTSSFSATSCQVQHTPPPTQCRAWSDLTSGPGSDPSAGDLYSPPTLAAAARVHDRARGAVNVYIDQETYDLNSDQLVIAGATRQANAPVGQVIFNAVTVTTNASGSPRTFDISGTFFTNQGFLQLRKENDNITPTGLEWADLLNQVVEYQNSGDPSASNFSIERSVTYTLGDGVAWPYHPDGTLHVYRYVEDDNINWTTARTQAISGSRAYFNETGYLATITSEAEQRFLARNLPRPNGAPPIAWVGGTDEDTEGEWIWRDGPEAGQQFWQGELTNGQPILRGNGAVDTGFSFTQSMCENQDPDRDGSGHQQGTDVHVFNNIGNVGADDSPYRYTKWSCAPNDTNRPEPSGLPGGAQEEYLLLSANAQGGETWNDEILGGSTGNNWLNNTGYIIEFGGDNEFFNRSTSQTFRVSPEQCVMMRETNNLGCLPGSGLSIGTASTNDFYGPSGQVENANLTQARVQIIRGFVSNGISDRDELALRGTSGDLINNNRTRRYEDVPLSNGATTVMVNGEYDFLTGVLRLTAESAVPARAMVSFLSQRVQLVSAMSSTVAKDIGFTLGDALVWSGHEDNAVRYYRFIENDGITWSDARVDSRLAARDYFGVPGYMATITSKAENDFIAGSFANQGSPVAGWLGAVDSTEGRWEWAEGPESGVTTPGATAVGSRMKFWNGGSGDGSNPVNLTGTNINASPPTSGNPMLDGSESCSANNPACCNPQYPAYHNQTAAQASAAATLLGQTGTPLKHHYFGYSESMDSDGNTVINTSKRFANWSCNNNTPQPSNSGTGGQDYLLITGSPLGGGMWNDVSNAGLTSDADIYAQQGYYMEYGGRVVNGTTSTWQDDFNDRRIGRVVRIPNNCEVPDGGFMRLD